MNGEIGHITQIFARLALHRLLLNSWSGLAKKKAEQAQAVHSKEWNLMEMIYTIA